jgi:hypothetical protein
MTPPIPAARPRLPDVFPTFAYLYRPADQTIPVEVQEADDWWRPPRVEAGIDVVLWGRLARNTRPSLDLVPGAVAREATIARLRTSPPGRMHLLELHRLPAVRRPGRLRGPVRAAVLSGALAELGRGERQPRVIDAVVAAAGGTSLGDGLRPSGDGSALATLPIAHGQSAELRVARSGHPKAGQRNFAALQALEAAGVGNVPRPIARGETSGAGWGLETRLTGGHTARLSPEVLREIIELLLAIPEEPSPAQATDDQIADVRLAFPAHADALDAACAAVRRWSTGLPSVLVHGDLWLNNTLVAGGHLAGVIDWDLWHPAGLPGTDVLNLLAAEERSRMQQDIGPLLVSDYWRSTEVLDALQVYFGSRGRPLPDAAGLAAIGVGWWASRVAAALDRGSRPADHPDWVARNVELPLERIARLEREVG